MGGLGGGAGDGIAYLLLLPIFIVVGGVSGAVQGAPGAVPADVATGADRSLATGLGELRLSERVAQAVVIEESRVAPYRADVLPDVGPQAKEAAPDYSELGARGYRSVLEIRVTKVGFAAGNHPGADPEIALRLVAEARLIDVKTGRPLWLHGLGYMSPPHKTSIWGRDSAALVRQELDYASNVLAERIVESALLGSDFSLLATGLVCGLEPSHPGPSRLDVDVSAVESLTPRLEWKPPPPPGQPADWERAQDIRYDLRIWHVATNSPPELIYERMGLTEPKHQLEQPLAPQTEYFWSVRARFTLDGQARTTRWNAGTANATLSTAIAEDVFWAEGRKVKKRYYCTTGCCLDYVPVRNFLRFRMP